MRWLVALPLVVLLGLAALFAVQLTSGKDASEIPSALLGRAVPATPLPALGTRPAFDPAALKGPALVNVFASWCAPCRAEHPVLMALSRELPVHGIAYKDEPAASAGFLAELGDPYTSVGVDRDGRAALEWGVTGVPETFLVDAQGRVRHRVTGPLTAERYEDLRERIAAMAPRSSLPASR